MTPRPAIANQKQGLVLVDDDPDLAAFLSALMQAHQVRMRVVHSAEALLESWPPPQREVILLDVGLPGMSGIELLERYTPFPIQVPVVVLTGNVDIGGAVRAMKAGAFDLVEKPPTANRLIEALTRAFEAEQATWARHAETTELRAGLMELTPREKEVLGLLVEGKTNADIAMVLKISTRTVEVHRSRIMEKTRSDSMTDLVNRLWRFGLHGLVEPN